jgi:hypothetical protein
VWAQTSYAGDRVAVKSLPGFGDYAPIAGMGGGATPPSVVSGFQLTACANGDSS